MIMMKTFEISVKDADGRVQTYEQRAIDAVEALIHFRKDIGWSHQKMQKQLVKVSEVDHVGD